MMIVRKPIARQPNYRRTTAQRIVDGDVVLARAHRRAVRRTSQPRRETTSDATAARRTRTAAPRRTHFLDPVMEIQLAGTRLRRSRRHASTACGDEHEDDPRARQPMTPSSAVTMIGPDVGRNHYFMCDSRTSCGRATSQPDTLVHDRAIMRRVYRRTTRLARRVASLAIAWDGSRRSHVAMELDCTGWVFAERSGSPRRRRDPQRSGHPRAWLGAHMKYRPVGSRLRRSILTPTQLANRVAW